VLSADIMKIPEMDILKTHCVMTVIGGEIVYQAAPGTAGIETDFVCSPSRTDGGQLLRMGSKKPNPAES